MEKQEKQGGKNNDTASTTDTEGKRKHKTKESPTVTQSLTKAYMNNIEPTGSNFNNDKEPMSMVEDI
eukprot:11360806-Ditylum_brightwellii.AAC.1